MLALLSRGQRLCRFADQIDQLDSLASSTSATRLWWLLAIASGSPTAYFVTKRGLLQADRLTGAAALPGRRPGSQVAARFTWYG